MFEIITWAYLITITGILVFLGCAAKLRDARDRRSASRPTVNRDYGKKLK